MTREDDEIAKAAATHGVSEDDERKARRIIEDAIAAAVDHFYAGVGADDLIGPIFSGTIHDWQSHKQTMRDFWSRMVLGTDRYDGLPLPPHVQLDIGQPHFERWLEIWSNAARQTMPEPLADLVIERSTNMSQHWISALEAITPQQRDALAGKD